MKKSDKVTTGQITLLNNLHREGKISEEDFKSLGNLNNLTFGEASSLITKFSGRSLTPYNRTK